MSFEWKWESESKASGDYGDPGGWTLGAGLGTLARESAQNSNDARIPDTRPELRFTLIELSGRSRTEFEDSLGWEDQLLPHVEAMARFEGQVMSDTLRSGLDHLAEAENLLLLRIEDRGCSGLTGPEFPDNDLPESDYGNFIKLCRLELFSGKEKAAGGSFGLGKAVYWRFSRIQTALFNSCLNAPWNEQAENRLFGVNLGTTHRHDGRRYEGRGYFGKRDAEGFVASVFADERTAAGLHLARQTGVPGTSVLVVGFYDPDNPELGIDELRAGLETGIEESFWPLITRDEMDFVIEVEERDGISEFLVDPSGNFTELCHALDKYDRGDVGESLEEVGDVVVRDVPVQIPRRKTHPDHDVIQHTAKLVVTLSDDQQDTLENKVCLFRGPGMVVETVDQQFPGQTYHAFLLAGLAVNPDSDDARLRLADDFFRLAEPPAHNQWIPRSGGATQTSLGSNYVAPYLPNLRQIPERIRAELRDLFGIAPPEPDHVPKAIARHLRFLGQGPPPPPADTKPSLTLTRARVDAEGRWEVEVEASMKNRPEGWSFVPQLQFVAVEGAGTKVAWLPASLSEKSGCRIEGGRVFVEGGEGARRLRVTFRGLSDPSTHPIPAEFAAVDITMLDPSSAHAGDEA